MKSIAKHKCLLTEDWGYVEIQNSFQNEKGSR